MSLKDKISIFFFIVMMLFLASNQLIQYHFQTDDTCVSDTKTPRTNVMGNLLEEEIHPCAFTFLIKSQWVDRVSRNHYLVLESMFSSLSQKVLLPPPERC